MLHKKITGFSSFQTFATETFQPVNGGTLIVGQFSAHPGFRLGFRVWGCCAVFLGVPIILSLFYGLLSGAVHLGDLLRADYKVETMGLLMLCSFPILFAVGRFVAAGEDADLHGFLKHTLEAHYV